MKSLAIGVVILALAISAYAQTPAPPRQVYDDAADARAEIAKSVARAQREHKRLLLVFGGNWCGDCLALDKYFHQPPAAGVIDASFIVVHVSIGRWNLNADVAKQYGIPLEKGVPAIAVLESDGTLLYAQRNGEFEPAGRMEPQVFVDFLNKWKPRPRTSKRQRDPLGSSRQGDQFRTKSAPGQTVSTALTSAGTIVVEEAANQQVGGIAFDEHQGPPKRWPLVPACVNQAISLDAVRAQQEYAASGESLVDDLKLVRLYRPRSLDPAVNGH
jgi:thioredoxin 1